MSVCRLFILTGVISLTALIAAGCGNEEPIGPNDVYPGDLQDGEDGGRAVDNSDLLNPPRVSANTIDPNLTDPLIEPPDPTLELEIQPPPTPTNPTPALVRSEIDQNEILAALIYFEKFVDCQKEFQCPKFHTFAYKTKKTVTTVTAEVTVSGSNLILPVAKRSADHNFKFGFQFKVCKASAVACARTARLRSQNWELVGAPVRIQVRDGEKGKITVTADIPKNRFFRLEGFFDSRFNNATDLRPIISKLERVAR